MLWRYLSIRILVFLNYVKFEELFDYYCTTNICRKYFNFKWLNISCYYVNDTSDGTNGDFTVNVESNDCFRPISTILKYD